MKSSEKKLQALRQELQNQDVDGFLVPHSDEYQSEYLPECAERLAWLSGFTGSAGYGIVLQDQAVVGTDSRYSIQIEKQVDEKLFDRVDMIDTPPHEWLKTHAAKGCRIGYDPKLHSIAELEDYRKALADKDITFVPVARNPVDAVRDDRPLPPRSVVSTFPEEIAGRSAGEKIGLIAAQVEENGGYAVILNKADSIAWALNIRGDDIKHNPLALSYLVVHNHKVADWFIDPVRVPDDVRKQIEKNVRIFDPAALENMLESYGKEAKQAKEPVLMAYDGLSVWFKDRIEQTGAETKDMTDPCVMPRACKTPEEQAAIIDAHVRDGVALARFLSWLDKEAPKGTQSEITVAEKLEAFRREGKDFAGLSFDTIAGWNDHGAIVHYRADDGPGGFIKPHKIQGNGMLLVDSGGQYKDGGTTDITRTIAVGRPTNAMRRDFTNVLKGHINIARQSFPEGTTGAMIDILARRDLWNDDKNYGHGTGHGVGCYLAVHESGAGINSRAGEFKAGMLVSNEPGFYKKDEYGIRIENLLLVGEKGTKLDDGSAKPKLMLHFNTVTLAPIDRRLIKTDMLERAELKWLNDYHARVYKTLSPHLDKDAKGWLQKACKPLKLL